MRIKGTPGDIASAGEQTLDHATLVAEATARAVLRLDREEESEQEQTISCTASSTSFAKVMMVSHLIATARQSIALRGHCLHKLYLSRMPCMGPIRCLHLWVHIGTCVT